MKYLWCLVVLLCPIVAGADKPRHNIVYVCGE
jgi:hypothetical protein